MDSDLLAPAPTLGPVEGVGRRERVRIVMTARMTSGMGKMSKARPQTLRVPLDKALTHCRTALAGAELAASRYLEVCLPRSLAPVPGRSMGAKYHRLQRTILFVPKV